MKERYSNTIFREELGIMDCLLIAIGTYGNDNDLSYHGQG